MMIERELWARKATEKSNSFVVQTHKQVFNFGLDVGIRIAREIAVEKFEWLKDEMKKRPGMNFAAEIKLLDGLIQYHKDLGEQEIEDARQAQS